MAILHLNFRSDSIARSVYPIVFLPDAPGRGDKPFQTLYFLHGYTGGGLETSMFSNFLMYSLMYDLAIVLIDGENSFYVDDEQRGALFSRYAGQEIVEVTRELLPLSRERKNTFIGGISMGGYGAMVNGLRFQENFSKIAVMSPALGLVSPEDRDGPNNPIVRGELLATVGSAEQYYGTYKDVEAAAEQAARDGSMPRLFMSVGEQDALVKKAFNRFTEKMTALNAPLTVWKAEGGHDHVFWKNSLTPLCEFLTERKAGF